MFMRATLTNFINVIRTAFKYYFRESDYLPYQMVTRDDITFDIYLGFY